MAPTAAWTKGTSALLLDILALARAEGVEHDLVTEWTETSPDLIGRSWRGPVCVDEGLALGGRDGRNRLELPGGRVSPRIPRSVRGDLSALTARVDRERGPGDP